MGLTAGQRSLTGICPDQEGAPHVAGSPSNAIYLWPVPCRLAGDM